MQTNNPISIRLNAEELKKVDDTAKKKGISRSNLIHAAINLFLSKETGESQNKTNKDVKLEWLTKRIYSTENIVRNSASRVNMISRQVDDTLKRVSILEKDKRRLTGSQKKLTDK